jgi:hypothetical protein
MAKTLRRSQIRPPFMGLQRRFDALLQAGMFRLNIAY